MLKSSAVIAIAMWALSNPLHAFDQWNVNATSCVADAGSIRNDLYLGTGGTIKFASGKIGNIVLYCPVSFRLPFTPAILGLVYYDDTIIAGNHVTAQLIKMDLFTGGITPVARVDSDSGPMSINGRSNGIIQEFTNQYDPINFAYYIRVDITRNVATANETVYALLLQP